MIKEIKEQLSKLINHRSSVLITLSHSDINANVLNDEIEAIRKLKEAYDKLDEVS